MFTLGLRILTLKVNFKMIPPNKIKLYYEYTLMCFTSAKYTLSRSVVIIVTIWGLDC